ncbi:MAG TPA: methyltransferase domain-containing protein [Gemmataceae bacterium]|nr:methyltransferase domain-containing protein [Gemmataceae bacterium]
MRYFEECGEFFRQCRRQFRTTGAILPSSRFLAKALVSEIAKPRQPARILEVGPGTGSVTRQLLRRLLPGDQFDAVEINANFIARLMDRLKNDRNFQRRRQQVRIIHSAVEDLPGDGTYDFIVSGLPLNNFPVEMVRRIFHTYARLLKPGGILTYYEYQFIRHIKSPFVNRKERRRLYRVGKVVGSYIRNFQIRRERIFINVPPAMVRHLRLKPVSISVAVQTAVERTKPAAAPRPAVVRV